MTLHWKWPRKLVPICSLAIGIAACFGSAAQAQIVPDATLPVNSEVNQFGSEIEINGGTQAGSNLFHSFEQFSVPAGVRALFNNSPNIENIFTRVTGRSISNIDGTLATNDANLFLLNPNGIVFGPNASLDIGGSFLGTTASSFHFEDGTFFSATGEQSTPLLTVSAPIGLQFGEAPGAIVNRAGSNDDGIWLLGFSSGLTVPHGETLALVGGEVRLEGGQLNTRGGRIELGSVGPNSQVNLTATDIRLEYSWGWGWHWANEGESSSQLEAERYFQNVTSLVLGYEGVQDFQDIQLSEQALVETGHSLYFNSSGSKIQMRGRDILLADSSKVVSYSSSNQAAELFVGAEQLKLQGGSVLGTYSGWSSRGGEVTIETDRLIVQDSKILLESWGDEDIPSSPGKLTVRATDFIELTGEVQENRIYWSETHGGVEEKVYYVPGGLIAENNFGSGGNINIETGRLTVRDGATVSVNSHGGELGGTAEIRASESIELSGTSDNGLTSGITAETFGTTGKGGSLIIETGRLNISDGAVVSVNSHGSEQGGTANIRASESIELSGEITADTFGSGTGGNLTIETDKLLIRDGGAVSVEFHSWTEEEAKNFHRKMAYRLEASLEAFLAELEKYLQAEGIEAGIARLEAEKLIVWNGAEITARAPRYGRAGNLSITADFAFLDNGSILATTGFDGGGNITLDVGNLQLRHNSEISTTVVSQGSEGHSGNIKINANTIVALENSGIRSQAVEGNGGNIEINTQGYFRSFDSDIDVSSQRGSDGLVTIEQVELDPSFGLLELEEKGSDTKESIEPGCTVTYSPESSYFINTGLGGIPENPGNPLFGDAFLDDLRLPEESASEEIAPFLPNPHVRAEIEISKPTPEEPIVEAQGWQRNDKGEIVLVAESSAGSAGSINSSWRSALGCDGQVSSLLENKDGLPLRLRSGRTGSGLRTGLHNKDGLPLRLRSGRTGSGLAGSGHPLRLRSGRTGSGSGLRTGLEQGVRRGDSRIAPTIALTSLPAIANKANTAPETFAVEQFQFAGNTAFSSEELAKVTKPFANRELSFEELIQARTAVSDLYIEAGYVTSGAIIPPQTLKDGTVEIKVVEATLENIDVKVSGNLDPNYIRDRLARGNREILNINDLVSTLQLLKSDQGLIEKISAELSALPRPGRNRLEVQVQESPPFSSQFTIDNRRSPSVGSFRRSARLNQTNLSGIGDRLSLGFSNTDGSNSWDLGYSLPINSRNGTLSFSYSNGESKIIEAPFDELDIEASSRSYELNLRQPIIQRVTKDGQMREVALGLRASRQESTTTILGGERFPLSPGADANGESGVSALRFYQEWTERDSQQVLAARSEFSLGVGALDGNSIFFGWRGQGQWGRRLGKDSMLLLKGNAQFSPNALASSEQFGIGGLDSVRGYRQDTLLADNGVLASAELRLPVYRLAKRAGVLQIAPFLDLGAGWNSDGRDNPATNVLMSAGVGLRFQLGNKLSTRFDWGIPLIDIDSRNRTWQEKGIYFSINYNPF